MSRKTNKTKHVLSLLSSGVKAEEEKEVNIEEKQPEAAKPEEKDPEEKKPEGKKEQTGSVAVVKKSEDDVAEDIRRSLEKEMEEYEEAVKKAQEASEKKAADEADRTAPAPPAESRPSSREEDEEAIPAIAQEQPESQMPEQKEEEPPAAEEDNFIIVNVMETLVRERAPEYIRQFGVCTCKRCQMDVEAEALSELPGKYVVINRHAMSPLINFYRTKFAGRVTVEVAKACMTVKNSPRHGDGGEGGDEKNEKKA